MQRDTSRRLGCKRLSAPRAVQVVRQRRLRRELTQAQAQWLAASQRLTALCHAAQAPTPGELVALSSEVQLLEARCATLRRGLRWVL